MSENFTQRRPSVRQSGALGAEPSPVLKAGREGTHPLAFDAASPGVYSATGFQQSSIRGNYPLILDAGAVRL